MHTNRNRQPFSPCLKAESRTQAILTNKLTRKSLNCRTKEDIEDKTAVLANQQEAKDAAAAVEVDLKARAAESALAGAGDGDAAAAQCADTTGKERPCLVSI
jgi:hypothetical protein